jgi:hypothetical protein
MKKLFAVLAIASMVLPTFSPFINIAHAATTVVPATGGTAIPASSAGTTNWTTLTGPIVTENAAGDIGNGNIRLLAPSGFEFDTTGVAPTVQMTRVWGFGFNSCNINGLANDSNITPVTRTASVITIDINDDSDCGVRNRLTWQNVRVRPISATPLVSGTIRKGVNFGGGDSNFNFPNDSLLDFGTLAMVASDPVIENSTVTVNPTSTIVGTNATITITLKDVSNNPVVGFSAGNLAISATGSLNTITKLASTTDANGQLQATITSTLAEAKTISVLVMGPNFTITQNPVVTFTPDAPAKAHITASATSSVVGNPITLTIDLKDQYDNVVADGQTATVVPGIGEATGTSTTVGGTLTRQINATTTGVATISFAPALIISTSSVTSVLFTPDVPALVVITTQPTSTLSVDAPFTTQPVVMVTDQYGNAVADNTLVTATPESPATGMLRNITVPTIAGIGTYGLAPSTLLGYSKANELFQIRFTAGSASALSDFLGPLQPGVLVKVAPTASPSSLFAGQHSALTIYGLDQFGNQTTDSGINGFMFADNGASLATTLFTLSGGSATSSVTKGTPGVVNVTTVSGILLPGATKVTFLQEDTEGPHLVTTTPSVGAINVSVSTPLLLTFSENLKSTTVNSGNIQLVNGTTEAVVPATVALVEGGTMVQITPTTSLEFSTPYFFQANTGVTDEAGNALTSDVSSSTTGFTTEEDEADHTAPTVVMQYPTSPDNVNVDIAISPSVDFSESMKSSTITPTSIQLRKVADDTVITGTVILANGGTRAIIDPTVNLEYATSYYLSVATTTTDEAGNQLATEYNGKEEASFTTADAPTDTTGPVISNIQAIDITTNTATITWSTNEPANSRVEYGLTSAYGSLTTLDTATTTTHSVMISGLLPNQTYHYRVYSTDDTGNQSVSADNIFETAFDDTASLAVTQINQVQSFATADDSFENGWRWVFEVTVPTDETLLSFKLSDLLGNPTGTIPAAANVRFYSAESSDATTDMNAIVLTSANEYAGPITLVTDRDAGRAGRQVQVVVEVKVPVGTPAGSYSASYGFKSEQLVDE